MKNHKSIFRRIVYVLMAFLAIGCDSNQKKTPSNETYSDVKIVGAMKDVMWKGELGGKIDLDTISDTIGLYGLGPQSHLTGELLINDGVGYLSKVTSDSTMSVEKNTQASAPFFVYANATEWTSTELPPTVKTIQQLEAFIDQKTTNLKRPFVFKVIGKIATATIHIQNFPEGTKVSSPEEAHQGQTNYLLKDEPAEIIGFFSTEHKGIFTHHDSFLHMHLITKDESKMGHLDVLEIGDMILYLPKQ